MSRIRKLDENVINRIAAGEVLQRPANAVKELIENSLDAGATSIKIIAHGGGLKLLQIQDNGCGIHPDDLAILCERFTTSKLSTYEDLKSIRTFGFRGEALASISHVAHLTITSMTADQSCAYRAHYADGKLVAKGGPNSKPKPVAGTRGTQITVTKALQSENEEYQRIVDVVTRYALHNSQVSFVCKKHGDNSATISTQSMSKSEAVLTLFGGSIARELVQVSLHDPFDMEAWITNVNYSVKKSNFVLFINNRLVESTSMKKAIESVYANYLPKGTHPFVYISLQCAPETVDVNVHPTKNEVHLLNETSIIQQIQHAINEKLLQSDHSRTFSAQNHLSNVKPDKGLKTMISQSSMIRTDSKTQTLHSFISPSGALVSKASSSGHFPRLASIERLSRKVQAECHQALTEIFRNFTYVGYLETNYAVIQHKTSLFVIDIEKLNAESVYQQCLAEFAHFPVIQLSSPVSIEALILAALETSWSPEDGPKEQIVEYLTKGLMTHPKPAILKEYFAMDVEDGKLRSLPQIIPNFLPALGLLPTFVFSLATKVNWSVEEECLHDICRELASYYSDTTESATWMVEHVWIPLYKKLVVPKSYGNNGTVFPIADLEKLYKIFERC